VTDSTGNSVGPLSAQASVSGADDPQTFGEPFGNCLIAVATAAAPKASCLGAFGKCFVAGTPVQMADGTTKPIENVQKGDIVVSPNGTAVEIPEGYIGRLANNGKGLVYLDLADIGVGNGNQNMVRVADPNKWYPSGYARFYNKLGQPVDAFGKPGPESATHFPF
jgi:hypothetical protein